MCRLIGEREERWEFLERDLVRKASRSVVTVTSDQPADQDKARDCGLNSGVFPDLGKDVLYW